MRQVFTAVAGACEAVLHGNDNLLMLVQDFLMPLVLLGPSFALRIGGRRLLRLWLEVATRSNVPVEDYTALALYEAIARFGDAFLDRAIASMTLDSSLWTLIVHVAANEDARHVLELLYQRMPRVTAPETLTLAAKAGNVSLLVWLQDRAFGGRVERDTLARAAASGSLETVQWLLASDHPHSRLPPTMRACALKRAMKEAAQGGYSSIVRWLVASRPSGEWTCYPVMEALRHGHVEIAEFLLYHYRAAVSSGQRILSRLDPSVVLLHAFTHGDVATLRWLHQHHLLVDAVGSWHVEGATMHGHVGVLAFLEVECPTVRDRSVPFGAAHAKCGSIAMAQWAKDRGLLDTSVACVCAAAEHGHIDLMRWYVAEMDSDGNACDDACSPEAVASLPAVVRNGHVACVQFLVARGWADATPETVVAAAAYGHLDMVRWLVDRCQCSFSLEVAAKQAAAGGHVEVVQWIHAQARGPTKTAIARAAAMGHAHLVTGSW